VRPEWAQDPIILVTMDGVRWQDVFEGSDPVLGKGPVKPAAELMPNLHRLAKTRGAALGAPGRGVFTAVGPNYVSLPGYIEILTGRKSLRCQDNDCPRIAERTFLDTIYELGAKVATFASWDRMDRAASARTGTFVLSYGRQGDPTVDASPGIGEYRADRMTADRALAYLEKERPDFLFLGLGDPDELGHGNDYPGYLVSLRQADAILEEVVKKIDQLGDRYARAHVFVTADHGRSKDFVSHGGHAPESGRVWLVAFGPRIKARGFVASPAERHLTDIVPTMRAVAHLPEDADVQAGKALGELFTPSGQ